MKILTLTFHAIYCNLEIQYKWKVCPTLHCNGVYEVFIVVGLLCGSILGCLEIIFGESLFWVFGPNLRVFFRVPDGGSFWGLSL